MSSLFLYIILAGVFPANALEGIKFYWYSPGTTPIEFSVHALPEVDLIPLEKNRKIKFLCHGWESNGNASWLEPTVNNYMATNMSEVVTIDWGKYAENIYPLAVNWTMEVGEYIGKALLNINEKYNVPLSDFHLIGHSLGSHVMGFAGQYVRTNKNQMVGRITGLDPAGPTFNDNTPNYRLSIDDADFVDIIHTNSHILGFNTSLGHIDFWPNGGRMQAGCGGDFSCSHNRAPIYFSESISSNEFPAWYCDSQTLFNEGKCYGNIKIYMGDIAPSNIRGDFYLNTNPEKPYGLIEM